jgi:cob(I)alamin adenosyltransferase
MRIYTRSGDKGTTSLIYGQRVPKNDARVEAYGTCDEANSMIGLAVSYLQKEEEWDGKADLLATFHKIQTILFHVGAELATPKDKEVMWKLKEEHVKELEVQIDVLDEHLEPLKNFILPSGHEAASTLHVARTVVRRAERVATAISDELSNDFVTAYLNRLSDFLFVAARYVNNKCGGTETLLKTDI